MMEAMRVDAAVDGLDPEQAAAVLAPRGPVCVLAGAGTGKTRTITRRIAHLVSAGHVSAGQVLAVTFTARAAGEMRSRLRALGVGGERAQDPPLVRQLPRDIRDGFCAGYGRIRARPGEPVEDDRLLRGEAVRVEGKGCPHQPL